MQVKCDYCSSWMEDNEEFCPNCGAANANLKRVANKTPQTIEELKEWYSARKLPPYETTRFFIGIDYKLPKAFGIYQDGEEFVVYKNKADGSRAVRYRGRDEAYAVNELYLRLKEEILNQKNANASKRSTNYHDRAPIYNRSNSKSTTKGCLNGCLSIVGIFVAFFVGIAILGTVISAVDSKKPQSGKYYVDGSNIYYYNGYSYSDSEKGYEWWQYNTSTEDWYVDAVYDSDKTFTDSLSKENYCGYFSDLSDTLGLTYDDYSVFYDSSPYNIYNSRVYIDKHHTAPYSNAYYEVDGQAYYYLYDTHGANYGNGDNSGWYTYGDSGWEYYSDGDDHDSLGDELWYDDDKYYLGQSYSDYTSGSVYYFSGSEANEWSADSMAEDFSNTTWYAEYESANEAYETYRAEQAERSSSSSSSSSWDNDSSWDWDSSDSWDSGSSDWDSDW